MERKVAIRPYRAEDEADLFALARAVFGDHSDWRDGRALAVLERDVVFVAEIEGSTAGYAAVERRGETVRIEQLLVNPAHEDGQVEIRLLEWAEGYAISLGARTLEALVERDNRAAAAFFRGRGFVPADAGLLELLLPQL
jgi:ribosomal protein S18 acetylase RimI-like enzyme